MKKLILLASLFSQVHGEIKIITEQLTFGTGFTFEKIPAPATNDAARNGRYQENLWKKHTGKSLQKLE